MVFPCYINKVFLTQSTRGGDQVNWIKLKVSKEDSFHVNIATFFSAILLAMFEQNKQNGYRDKQYNKVK